MKFKYRERMTLVDADFLLIRKMKQGEEAAFDSFVHKYYKEVFIYCSYHCPDKDYAEDMTQETLLSGEIESAEHPAEEILNKLTIEWALKQLPDELREVITLYYFQELKLTEIADVLHISLPLVKYRLKQAKKQLEKLLRKEENDESGRTAYDL